MQPTQEITKKKKWLLPVILGVAALLVIGLGVGGFIYIKSVALPKKELQKQLNLGEEYLKNQDYDKAIPAYKAAIDIDPKCEDAYISLGRAYTELVDECIENGDMEDALDYLKDGIKYMKAGCTNVSSGSIKSILDELKDKKNELKNDGKVILSDKEHKNNALGAKTQLIMATNAEFSPYEYYEGDTVVGIDVEIAQAIADEVGAELVIEDMTFDSVLTAVQSGQADMGIAGLTITEDRLQYVDFSNYYAIATQVIIVNQDSAIDDPDDLIGKTIGVKLGTTGDIYSYDIEDATIERYNKGFEAVQALLQGKVDAVIIDNEPAKVFVSENEGIRIVDKEFTVEEYAIAVKKGNSDLLEKVNKAIEKLQESGKLQEIVDKYIKAE